MCQISIEIPEAYLANPAVAKALVELTMAIGGHVLEPPVLALIASDARIEKVPAANDDKISSASTGQEDENSARQAFYLYLQGRSDTAVATSLEVVSFYRALEEAGDAGISSEQAMGCFSSLPEGATGKALGGIFGGLFKGLKNRGMDLPHESRGGRYYIKPWPKA